MKKLLSLFAFSLCGAAFALDPSGWQYRQPFDIGGTTGPARIAVPADTLGGAQSDLQDLRILSPDGAELPYAVLKAQDARAAYETSKTLRRDATVMLDSERRELAVTIETDTDERLDSVELLVPDTTDYLLPAHVEISGDGRDWETVARGQALFRRGQGGRHDAVVQNTLSLGRRAAAWVRVTIAFEREPVAVTGARLRTVTSVAARAAAADAAFSASVVSTEQRQGETLLTVDLGAANLRLSEIEFRIADPLFMRGVTIADDGGRVLARGGSLYRVVSGARINAEKTALDLGGLFVPTRRIVVHVENGGSPPLRIGGDVAVKRRPAHIVFNPASPGRHVFLSGNPQAVAPRYDIEALSATFADMPVTEISPGVFAAVPDYRAPKVADGRGPLVTRSLFWVALAFAVAVLLFVIGRLLPGNGK